MTKEEEVGSDKKRKSLLDKYEIPISHLDFSYVKECNSIIELERIIKILRSNEEGCYPELLECAEERLRCICPESKLLRIVEPILTRNQLDPEEWKSVQEDILSWKEEVDDVDIKLSLAKDMRTSVDIYPEVRRPKGKVNGFVNDKGEKKDSSNKVSATDYKKWDMYDADSECLKLDLEEEKKKEEQNAKEIEGSKKMETSPSTSELSLEEKELQQIAGTAEGLSPEERKILAVKEKDLGNEFYQTNRLNQALRHYTRSIYLNPTAVAYNNRAATYLKQCRFSKALDDLNIVLSMEPENIKGRFRRAMSLQHKNEFQKALEDISVVLKYQPNHVLARHVADQLRENCYSLPRKIRVRIPDLDNPKKLVIKEVTEEELKTVYKDLDYLEVNDLNLPKIMCNCNGKYTNDPSLKSNDPIRFQHLRERYAERSYNKVPELERSASYSRPEPDRTSLSSSKRVKPMSVSAPEDMSTGEGTTITGKRNKPLVEPANPQGQGAGVLFGGAKRLDIVELEKIEEEDHSPNKQQHVSVEKTRSPSIAPSTSPTTCLVSDMRQKQIKKVYFGEYTEEEADLPPPLINDPTSQEKANMCSKGMSSQDINGYGSSSAAEPEIVGSGFISDSYMEEAPFIGPQLPSDMALTSWDSQQLPYPMIMKNFKNSPQSPLSNSSSNDFSSDIDSDDDEFPDDENSTDRIIDMNQVERVIDNDVDTISKDFFPYDNLLKCECGEGYKLRPTQFELKWLSFENSINSINERGKLIRLVCPHQLSSVIGNTLTEQLLSGFIYCLNNHFDAETETDKILAYLQAISSLPRFKIISSFLSAKTKAVADELLKKVHPTPNRIEEAFS